MLTRLSHVGMISQRARYAFKAVVALARAKPGEGLQIRQLCEQEKLPRKFLEQILLTLKAAGYITSRRGRDGGYELLKPADTHLHRPLAALGRRADRAASLPVAHRLPPLRGLPRRGHCELRIAFAKAYAQYLYHAGDDDAGGSHASASDEHGSGRPRRPRRMCS